MSHGLTAFEVSLEVFVSKRAQVRAGLEPATALGWLRRHLSEIHRQRRGLICLSSATGLQYS
jgi:hypothetical protein